MVFAFRHQPLRAFYLTFTVITLLLVKFPFYALRYSIPSARPRPTWSFKRSMMVVAYRAFISIMYNTSIIVSDIEKLVATDSKGFVRVEATPDLVTGPILDAAKTNNVSSKPTSGFWYGSNGLEISQGGKARQGEKVIYHFGGGGFVRGTSHPSSGPQKTLADGLVQNLPGKPALFSLEYRKSSAAPFTPANPFPAALLDAVAGYSYLVREVGVQPENIIIAGDSSGGLLAFWLARYLAICKLPQLPMAGGLLLLSPTVDWANTQFGPTSSMRKNASTDFVYPILASGYGRRALLGNIPESEASTNPWIAPGSAVLEHTPGLFAGLPHTCIICGGAEQTLHPMKTLRERLEKDIGATNVKYLEFPDAIHDFLINQWHEPERGQALEQLGEWLRNNVWINV